MHRLIRLALVTIAVGACGAAATVNQPTASPSPCQSFAPLDRSVGAEIQHLKTSASVVRVTSACSVRVLIAGGASTLAAFTNKEIVLRATTETTYASATPGDLDAIGRFGLKPGEVFTLSFDGRPFSDGSYPINFMNR